MPYEITLPQLPAGYNFIPVKKGEKVSVIVREFTSSEDGDLFMSRLEGFPTDIINLLPGESEIKPANVSHMLAIIRRDRKATVYVNEIEFIAQVLTKGRDIEAGEVVYEDDVADIGRLIFKDINIPPDAGLLFLFSLGWRKGLYYDFRPLLGKEPELRDYDIEMLSGQYLAYLSFQHLFKIKDEEWNKLLEQQWFPFISLKRRTIEKLINHAKNGWNIDELIEPISVEVDELVPSLLKKWERKRFFQGHFPILRKAAERYLEKDYISATSILYPRIEGLMRTYHLDTNQPDRASQGNLTRAVVEAHADQRHAYSLLLPGRFQRYLKEIYFANFDPNNPKVLSRHSVSHGVAPADLFSQKAALIGLLTLDQISFCLGSETDPVRE